MQIYTKILLGMAIGVALGVTLGPKSDFLERDLYRVNLDAKMPELRLDVQDPSSVLPMPERPKDAKIPLKLALVDTLTEARVDSTGQSHDIPTWAKVKLKYGDRLQTLDTQGVLAAKLGNPKKGESVIVWMKLKEIPLDSGGFTTQPEPVSGLGTSIIEAVKPVGTLFMRLIKMVIVPLVFSSLLVGIASLGDLRKLGRMGARTLGTYMLTTAIAVTIGLTVAHAFQPGTFIGEADRASLTAQFADDAGDKAAEAASAPSAIDNILNIVPDNPIESLASGDMLQVIFFACIFGIALTILGAKESQMLVTAFDRIQEAMVVIIHMVMAIAPFGVAALVADVVGNSGVSVLAALLVYGLTVLTGLLIHMALIYGGLVRFWAKLPLRDFFRAIRPAQLIAFSTSSSAAALPVSMECAEENLHISNSVASFVLPLGSTVNMDGTALYQGVAAIFIAQVFQIDLTMGDQLAIVLTATMASVGAAGVPGAGMITLAMVLTATGIPTVGVALILGMDRLLDMFRTAVNVTGDLSVTAVMARAEGESLFTLAPEADFADPDRGFEGRLSRRPEPIEPAPAKPEVAKPESAQPKPGTPE